MIISEKIKALRKVNDLSQEDLAEKLNISRQSISKWEMKKSIPDLDRILDLSKIFGVSVDFLLDDEKDISDLDIKEEMQKISLDYAREYIKTSKKATNKTALAISLIIISSIPYLAFELMDMSERMNSVLSFVSIFFIILLAVILFFSAVYDIKKYKELEDVFTHEYGVVGIIKDEKETFRRKNIKYVIGAVILIALLLAQIIALDGQGKIFENISYIIFMLGLSFSVNTFIRYIGLVDSYEEILQEESYSIEKKQGKDKMFTIKKIYWVLVFLLVYAYLAITKNYQYLKMLVILAIGGFIIMNLLMDFLKKDK